MIHDLDGSEPGASRRIHMIVLSTVVAIASLVGWAAASSPAFQGPFATPYPRATPAMHTVLILDQPNAYARTWCSVANGPITVNAFSGDHPVTIVRQPVPPANPCRLSDILPIPVERVAP